MRVEEAGIRITISIFLLLFWLPGGFYIFIIPYMVYMKEDASIWVYYVISVIAIVWYFIWSIANFADVNGWVMVTDNSDNDRGAAAFFGIIGSALCTLIAALGVINLILFCRRNRLSNDDD